MDSVCVWRVNAEVVIALDATFGEPVDAYVNGSQVWLRDDGPSGEAIEWRLHPVAGFRRPAAATTDELFASVALALAQGAEPLAPLGSLWDGLEAFAAYGDELEPAPLADSLSRALGIAPDASGLVDHGRIGDEWERSGGKISITERLLTALTPLLPPDG